MLNSSLCQNIHPLIIKKQRKALYSPPLSSFSLCSHLFVSQQIDSPNCQMKQRKKRKEIKKSCFVNERPKKKKEVAQIF